MPHVIERARTGRAKCRGCGRAIAAGTLRFGERLPNPFADGEAELTHWFHAPCAAFMRPEPFLETLPAAADPIDDRERLEREAQLGASHRRLPRATTVGRAPTGRAACRSCHQPIEKGAWRIALLFWEEGRFTPAGFIHLPCAAAYFETTDVLGRLQHFTPDLSDADLAEIRAGLQ